MTAQVEGEVVKSFQVRQFILRIIECNLTGCAVAKTADLILIMLDATKSTEQRRLLEHELDAVGIRLNKTKPDGEQGQLDDFN